jgi:hypothetical protein
MLRRSALRSRFRNAPRPVEKSVRSYLAWLGKRPCYLDGHALGGCGWGDPPRKSFVEAAHVDHGGDKGMGTKASDRFAIPLCQKHHDEQHGKIGAFKDRGGWPKFQARYGFNAIDVAGDYWHLWPGRRAWERKQIEVA